MWLIHMANFFVCYENEKKKQDFDRIINQPHKVFLDITEEKALQLYFSFTIFLRYDLWKTTLLFKNAAPSIHKVCVISHNFIPKAATASFYFVDKDLKLKGASLIHSFGLMGFTTDNHSWTEQNKNFILVICLKKNLWNKQSKIILLHL